jgi:DNA replication protein DnaC
MLCVDDFGSEPTESAYMGNRLEVMRCIIENRGDRRDRLTHIISNLPPGSKQLKEKYGDRVQSRLFEMCNYFELRGQDRRRSDR